MADKKTIEGLQELQNFNLRLIAGLKGPYLDRATKAAAIAAHRYTVRITHVVSGALRASHRIRVDSARHEAIISIDKTARNPSGALVAAYGEIEHDRGGSHAFYKRTVDEFGEKALIIGGENILESIRNGSR